jgi:taurine--2-oxoglutarate transaminase
MAELAAECKKRGLWPFTNMNRLHVVPPCNVSEAEAKEGLAILDEVLTLTDRHTA